VSPPMCGSMVLCTQSAGAGGSSLEVAVESAGETPTQAAHAAAPPRSRKQEVYDLLGVFITLYNQQRYALITRN
jgi:hypothetical protein